jgi:tetratricopeptide (TPR) repeat protein
MALFDALGELVGAAVLTAAPVCDLIVPTELVREPAAFVAWLQSRGETAALDSVVEALAREIWVGAETRGLAQETIDRHTVAVAAILTDFGPSEAHIAQAVARARASGQAAAHDPVARGIAKDIFARANAAGVVEAADLKDDVTIFLIERAYANLLDSPRTLYALGPVLADFIAARSPAGVNQAGTPNASVSSPGAGPAKSAAEPAAPSAGAARQSSAQALAGLGLSPAMTERLAAAGGTALLADLRERFSLNERAMRRILGHLDQQGLKPDRIIAEFEGLASWVGDVRAQLTKPTNEEADIRRLKSKAAAALADGDFEAAVDALRQLRRELRDTRRRIEERLEEEVTALRRQMTEEARATSRLAELAMARNFYAEAAELFSEAAVAMPSTDRDGIWRLHLKRADALYRAGERGRDARVLAEALAAYNLAIRLVADGSNPSGLGHASLGLANTLLLVGEQEAGAGRLQDAVSAYRKAIAMLDRDEDAAAWSAAQLQLGRSLTLIGERQQAPAMLREAADAYREALSGLSAARTPGDFAAAHMGLGAVLLALEEREGGTSLLAEAATAYNSALDTLDQKSSLAAECRLNLGLALLGLGEQQRSLEHLQASAQALRTALEGYARGEAPKKWALVQMNLGNALAAIGDLQGADGAPRLEEAVAAYNAAVEEFPREGEPLKWAITQMNLGTALIRLGERRDKRRHWLAAAGALVPALEAFEMQGADAYADITRRNLRRFHESWEQLISAPDGSAEPQRTRITRAG